jgi:hypothetical protein
MRSVQRNDQQGAGGLIRGSVGSNLLMSQRARADLVAYCAYYAFEDLRRIGEPGQGSKSASCAVISQYNATDRQQ